MGTHREGVQRHLHGLRLGRNGTGGRGGMAAPTTDGRTDGCMACPRLVSAMGTLGGNWWGGYFLTHGSEKSSYDPGILIRNHVVCQRGFVKGESCTFFFWTMTKGDR